MKSVVLISVILVVVVVIVAFVFFKNRNNFSFETIEQDTLTRNDFPFETMEQDALTMKEVIEFFKQDEVLKILKENRKLLAVAIRKNLPDNKIQLILTLFDTTKEDVIEFPSAKAYIVKTLDSDLEQNFGDKEMIILK